MSRARDLADIADYTIDSNLTFGDNDKAFFGAGSDLQIYHDGIDSYVRDNGTGDLYIEGSDDIRFRTTSGQTYAVFNENASVNLYHNNSLKFETTATGVDVTGTVTADDVVISDTNPTLTFFETDTTNLNTKFDNGGGDLYIQTVNDDGTSPKTRLLLDHATGDISFYEDTGTSAKFFWDASTERLLVGNLYLGEIASNYDKIQSTSSAGLRLQSSGGSVYLDSGGALLVNRTANSFTGSGLTLYSPSSSYGRINAMKTFDGSVYAFRCYHNGASVGGILYTNTSTTYSTSSDYRLKTAVNYDWDATTRLKQLRPARFEWISDGDDAVPVDGFLAHEVQSVVPEAISGTHNEVDDDGNPVYQGIDQSKLTPLLAKALIEAVEKIEQLETRIAALEAN